jgi:cytochrome b
MTSAQRHHIVGPRHKMVRVWDPFVRLFHWFLAGLFVFCFATGDLLQHLHEWAGYAIIGLIVSRICWGLIGPRHARFADFIYRPAVVIGFLFDSVRFRAPRFLGHNPAGGAMVIALLGTLSVICGTGVMMGLDAFWGAAWVEDLHVVGHCPDRAACGRCHSGQYRAP